MCQLSCLLPFTVCPLISGDNIFIGHGMLQKAPETQRHCFLTLSPTLLYSLGSFFLNIPPPHISLNHKSSAGLTYILIQMSS